MSVNPEVFDKVVELVRQQCDYTAEITPDTHLFHDVGFDSLDAAEFVMDLEEAFDVSVTDEEAQTVATVGQAVSLLERTRMTV